MQSSNVFVENWLTANQVPDIGGEVELYSQLSSNPERCALPEFVKDQSLPSSLQLEPQENWTKEPEEYDTMYMAHVADIHLKKTLPNMRSENAKCWVEFKATSAYEPLSTGDESSDNDSINKKSPAGSIIEVQFIQKNRNMNDQSPMQLERRLKTKTRLKFQHYYSSLGRCFQCKLCEKAVREKNRICHLKHCLKAAKKRQGALAKELLSSLLNNPF